MDWKRLEEIEARAEKATEGPWGENWASTDVWVEDEGETTICDFETFEGGTDQAIVNATFVARSREDIPWLCEQLREAVAVLQCLRDHLAEDPTGEQYFGMIKADDFLARFEK